MRIRLSLLFFILLSGTVNAQDIPYNATKSPFGDGWTCNRGYYKSSGKCHLVEVPKNGKLNYHGNSWICNKGFYKSDNHCLRIEIPQNATLNFQGDGWICNAGFKKVGDFCVAMTSQEVHLQIEREKKIFLERQKKNAQTAIQGNCDKEYNTNAEVCVKITNDVFNCNKKDDNDFYENCHMSLSYDIETNYEGDSHLDVLIECKVEIEYKGKNTFYSESNTLKKVEKHSLHANGQDSNNFSFDFSFSVFNAVTKTKVRFRQCNIKNIDLL